MKNIAGKTVLITGANRGLGRAFVEECLAAGAAKIYAAARQIDTLSEITKTSDSRIVPVQLDVTQPARIADVSVEFADVSVLINNAGVAGFAGVIQAADDTAARREIETNYFGVLSMMRAFAPVLAANGGGAIINVSSIAGHVNIPILGSYSASKAAVHSLTQGARAELAAQGTRVVGVYPGPIDTDMSAQLEAEKVAPNAVAQAVLNALEAGEEDVYPDPFAVEMHAGLLSDPKAVERQAGSMLPA